MAIFLRPLKHYNGSDPSKRREYERDAANAEKISAYVNARIDELKDGESAMITYGAIANRTGIPERKIHDYCLQLDSATNNSIEISKGMVER